MFCIDEGSRKVWRQRNETDLPSCIARTVKFPQNVMVWGCLSHRGVGKLCMINGTVIADVYVNILEHFLVPTIEDEFGVDLMTFQQDL